MRGKEKYKSRFKIKPLIIWRKVKLWKREKQKIPIRLTVIAGMSLIPARGRKSICGYWCFFSICAQVCIRGTRPPLPCCSIVITGISMGWVARNTPTESCMKINLKVFTILLRPWKTPNNIGWNAEIPEQDDGINFKNPLGSAKRFSIWLILLESFRLSFASQIVSGAHGPV